MQVVMYKYSQFYQNIPCGSRVISVFANGLQTTHTPIIVHTSSGLCNNKTSNFILDKNDLPNIEYDVTTSKVTFLTLSFRKCISKSIFEKYFYVYKTNTSTDKKQFKIVQLFVVTIDMSC